jgi:hypothetical protein
MRLWTAAGSRPIWNAQWFLKEGRLKSLDDVVYIELSNRYPKNTTYIDAINSVRTQTTLFRCCSVHYTLTQTHSTPNYWWQLHSQPYSILPYSQPLSQLTSRHIVSILISHLARRCATKFSSSCVDERLTADNSCITRASTNWQTVFAHACLHAKPLPRISRMHTHTTRHWLTYYANCDVVCITDNNMRNDT